MIDVVMPQLGESVAEGTVTKWLVQVGDRVSRQQPIVVVSTDKADSEVTSTAEGRVARIAAAEGETLATGKLLCTIDDSATAAAEPSKPASAPVAPASAPVAPGPAATPRAPVQAPPAALHVAPVSEQHVAPSSARTAAAPVPAAAATGAPAQASAAESRPLASPSTRKAALEAGVDLRAVPATGDRGRITQEDVRKAASPETAITRVESRPESAITAPPSQQSAHALVGERPAEGGASVQAPARAEVPASRPDSAELAALIQAGGGFVPPTGGLDEGAAGRLTASYAPIPGVGFGAYKVPPYTARPGDKVVPFTRRRRITADHMVYSKVTAPHVVTVAEVDLHATSKLREEHKERFKKDGLSLTFLAFVCAAVIKALRENPEVNARVLDSSYVVLKDINLGVAVDTPGGLIVPSIKQADQLSLRGIAAAIDAVASRARAGKVTADDLANTTFTVSNPGLKGNLFGAAIISQPNVGILRMGEIKKRAVVVTRDGEDVIAIHPVMYVALSYDHRIIDGVLANSFLWRVAEVLSKGEFEV